MARKKHHMKMFSSPREILMASLAAGFVLVFVFTLPRVFAVDFVLGVTLLLHPELSGEDHLPGGGVDPELEIGVAVEQGADSIVHLHRLETGEKSRIRVERQLRSLSFSRSLSHENRSSVKALK